MNQAILQAQALSRGTLGAWGEACAAEYLRREGYKIHERNWHARGGELDIIAYDPAREAIVAVEVKTRRASRAGEFSAGTPEEAVTPLKLQRLRALAGQWASSVQLRARRIAIDVIGVAVRADHYSINHLKDVQ